MLHARNRKLGIILISLHCLYDMIRFCVEMDPAKRFKMIDIVCYEIMKIAFKKCNKKGLQSCGRIQM